jgi:hypothetical protein
VCRGGEGGLEGLPETLSYQYILEKVILKMITKC